MTPPDAKDEALLAAALAGLLPPERPAPETAGALRDRVLAAAREGRTQVVRADEGEWQAFVPGIRVKLLRQDPRSRTQTSLWRIDPGAMIPPHSHVAEEECLVLEGAIVHDGIRYAAGDFLLAAPGARHHAFTSPEGALLLIRGESLPDPARVRAALGTPRRP